MSEKKYLDSDGLLYFYTGIKNKFVSGIRYDSTGHAFKKTINGQETVVISASDLKTEMALNSVGNFKAVSTVAGQNLTETEKANARANIGAGSSGFSGSFNDLTDVPTTIAGYGITDASIQNGTITLGANTITPITAHQDISGKADKATTIAGYGITDAKIQNGIITLGSTAIKPITSHQDISGKADKATTIAGYGITDASATASGSVTLGATTVKFVSVAANQGLSSQEKENARNNLGISITELYKYKGSVATVAALDDIVDKAVGDVYNVTSNGKNYAWTGTEWDDLGGEFEITAITNSEIDTILAT